MTGNYLNFYRQGVFYQLYKPLKDSKPQILIPSILKQFDHNVDPLHLICLQDHSSPQTDPPDMIQTQETLYILVLYIVYVVYLCIYYNN